MAIYPERPSDRARDESQKLQAGRLWRQISPERRQTAADAFWRDEDAAPQQAEALMWIARQLKFRPKTVQRLPVERKIRHLASLGGVPESVAIRALAAYHLAHQRPMMGAFLDALGITHDNGALSGEEMQPPDAAKLKAAADALLAAYPREDVELYFTTLVAQDVETWGGLEEILLPQGDPR